MDQSPLHYARTLIAQHRGRGPTWAVGGNANHLPMTLAALAALGASAEQMDSFVRSYIPRLAAPQQRDAQPFADTAEALAFLSQFDAVQRFEASFDAWLARDGRAHVLAQWLPMLLPGAAAAAFHGLIRTAYGVQFENDAEIASGLAYWAATYWALPPISASAQPALPVEQALLALDTSAPLHRSAWQQAPIMGRLREVAGHSAFAAALPKVDESQELVHAALAFAQVYQENMSFTSLHCVTALYAAQVLLPCTDAPSKQLAQQLWPALAAAHVVARSNPAASSVLDTTLNWAHIKPLAAASVDDHVIKMVFTCGAWNEMTGEDVFRRCAAKLVVRGES